MVEMAMDGVPTKKVTRITEVVGISQVHEVIAVWDQDQE